MNNSTNKQQNTPANKAKIAAYSKQYRLNNKAKIAAYSKQYRSEPDNKAKSIAYRKQYRKQHYLDNKAKISASAKQYRLANKDKLAAYNKQYKLDNKAKIAVRHKQWILDNKAKLKDYIKQYNLNNKAKTAVKVKRRYETDPLFKSKCALRASVCNAFRRIGQNKPARTEQLLGCSWLEAKAHFERLFKEGMSWENHGEWHIDHIRPVASFKMDELHLMNHINNLQPLWAEENLGSKKLSDITEWLLSTSSTH